MHLQKLDGMNTMSLKINNRATPRQIKMLKDMGYMGKWDLSTDEAAAIITELFDQRRIEVDTDSLSWDVDPDNQETY